MNRGLDTDEQVFFYEQDYYVLSNFSAFTIMWKGIRFYTSEHVYHWEKFQSVSGKILVNNLALCNFIKNAPSAHEAYKFAQRNRIYRRPDWDEIKVDIMRDILKAKVTQHEYVMAKLLDTDNRELIENSWRDDFWGWGPNKDGKNMLGKLWMEIRDSLKAT